MSTVTLPLWTTCACAALTICSGSAMAHEYSDPGGGNSGGANASQAVYESRVLVSNAGMSASVTDPNLINGWGLVFTPTSFAWVNAEGTGKAVVYDGKGAVQSLVVTVPAPGGAASNPTGIVYSLGMDFVVKNGATTGPARFLFATNQGTIAGWSPDVDQANAFTVVDNSAQKAVYTGLALSGNGTTHLLYACNFSMARIDVFDGTFAPATAPGGFKDPQLPAGYSPFGIQAIGGDLYVTYAKQEDAGSGEEVKGAGLGVVDVFDPEGNLIRRIASNGPLNAPWGIAQAPASFGRFGGALLIGNLGDGVINAFEPVSGKFLGALSGADDKPIKVDGLWGIQFGNGISNQPTNSLFWAAGPNDEADGAFGVIDVVTGQ